MNEGELRFGDPEIDGSSRQHRTLSTTYLKRHISQSTMWMSLVQIVPDVFLSLKPDLNIAKCHTRHPSEETEYLALSIIKDLGIASAHWAWLII